MRGVASISSIEGDRSAAEGCIVEACTDGGRGDDAGRADGRDARFIGLDGTGGGPSPSFSFPVSLGLSLLLRFSFSSDRLPPIALTLADPSFPLKLLLINPGLHRVLPVPPLHSGEKTSRP